MRQSTSINNDLKFNKLSLETSLFLRKKFQEIYPEYYEILVKETNNLVVILELAIEKNIKQYTIKIPKYLDETPIDIVFLFDTEFGKLITKLLRKEKLSTIQNLK